MVRRYDHPEQIHPLLWCVGELDTNTYYYTDKNDNNAYLCDHIEYLLKGIRQKPVQYQQIMKGAHDLLKPAQ